MTAILYVVAGIFSFSAQDVIIKHLSGSYAIHEIVLFRCFVSLPVLILMTFYQGRPLGLVGPLGPSSPYTWACGPWTRV